MIHEFDPLGRLGSFERTPKGISDVNFRFYNEFSNVLWCNSCCVVIWVGWDLLLHCLKLLELFEQCKYRLYLCCNKNVANNLKVALTYLLNTCVGGLETHKIFKHAQSFIKPCITIEMFVSATTAAMAVVWIRSQNSTLFLF